MNVKRQYEGLAAEIDRAMTLLSAMAGLVALSTFALLHRKGIGITPDGWAYWQGAVSLSEGRGYAYFSGNPILAWPPLYSLYLSAWVQMMGPTGAGLVVANAALIALQASLWCWVSMSLWRDTESAAPQIALVAVAVYLGLFVALEQRAVLADVMKFTFLPLLVLATWKARRADRAVRMLRWATSASVVGALALSTHNNSVAFVAASALLIGAARTQQPYRTLAAAVVVLFPLLVWFIVRQVLGQSGSHEIGFRLGRYDTGTYLLQLVRGAGSLFVPDRCGAPFAAVGAVSVLILVSVMRRQPGSGALGFGAVFVGISAMITFGLFNLTFVNDPLSGRFLIFAPIILMPLVILTAAQRRAVVSVPCLVIALLPVLYWTTTWVHINTAAPIEQLGFPGGFVPHRARVSPAYPQGPPIEIENGLLLSPIAFEEPAGRVR